MNNSLEPYRLYWYPGTCARVIYVALREIGLPYEAIVVDRSITQPSSYLEVNPKNKVPALQVGSRVITENPAIQTYLARRHPEARLLPTEGDEGIEALEMVSWFAAGLHRYITPLRFPGLFCDQQDAWPSVRAKASSQLEGAFEIIDKRLDSREWILGSWSLADVHLLWLWFRATGSGMDGSRFANCIRHAAQCEARPSVAFVLDREEQEFERLCAAGAVDPETPAFQAGRARSFAAHSADITRSVQHAKVAQDTFPAADNAPIYAPTAPAKQPAKRERNWAGNYAYAGVVLRPESVEALQELVASSTRIGFLGSRHSFNAIAESDRLVDMGALAQEIEIDHAGRRVSVSGGTTYGALAPVLQEQGLALANLASLPHISVAGAISTGTHGSGATIGSLANAVSALEIIDAGGELKRITREDPEFAGYAVSLGALGAIVRVELEVEAAYEVAQSVIEHIPFSELTGELRAVMGSAYSVSLFTLWEGDVTQGWFKARTDAPTSILAPHGGTPATDHLHPLGLSPENSTPQLGIAGPWFERLPHFRLGFTPSVGDEIQSEYLLDWRNGEAAIEAMLRLGPSIRDVLQVCEIRTIARDELWLSPACGRDTMAIHFTWRLEPAAVEAAVRTVEDALLPLGARPHWGKLFLADRQYLASSYPMLESFVELAVRLDPGGKFRNDWLDTHVFG